MTTQRVSVKIGNWSILTVIAYPCPNLSYVVFIYRGPLSCILASGYLKPPVMCSLSAHIIHGRFIGNKPITVFFKTRGHLLVCELPGLVLPGLVSSWFVWVWVIFNIQFWNNHEYPFHTFHIYAIPQEHCANQLQPVLLTVIIMYGGG